MENQVERNGRANWFKESILAKLLMIGTLSLLLLIPSSWVKDLVIERQGRQEEVMEEIGQSWSGKQKLSGPLLVLPYKEWRPSKNEKGDTIIKEYVQQLFLLPEQLNIKAKTDPQILHRGIFDAVVYHAAIRLEGTFGELDIKKADISPDQIMWEKAQIVIGIGDLKGIGEVPKINLGDKVLPLEPDFSSFNLFQNNLTCVVDLSSTKSTTQAFNLDLQIRGSESLAFMPLGKETKIDINGNWPNPSFSGTYLPESRQVSDSSFVSKWHVSHFNRPFPQQWSTQAKLQMESLSNDYSCGVNFLLPVDQYQKTMRSAKYAMLIIMLTFVSLFFTELIMKRTVHIIQYVLIGLAMIIYYSLLLSLAEQVGFSWAYFIASVATILLISSFVLALLKNRRAAAILTGVLTVFYIFVYVIIQLQEIALLAGSIGLFVVVALLMYASSKINWDSRQKPITP
ncbi:cell envelope integrity protein CreD [Olivibacter sitiensis]|uniref:cell envelope integrity protein CreD n=1 Tax=Olivibacter sitiensis TaxID=376470 RepID=UPI0004046E36|nr:cell envelope integrity protein CreD [Olivibacter sitiensis]